MCISFVHHLHAQTSSIQNVSPSVKDVTLVVLDRLVEVKPVEIEGHRGNTKSGELDTDNRPCCQEEVE